MKVRNMLGNFVLLLTIGLAPISAHCGTITGTIASILYSASTPNFIFVYMSASSTGAPACVSTFNRMTVDLTVPWGRTLYAHLLALRLTNPAATITLVGNNTCAAWAGTENIQYTIL